MRYCLTNMMFHHNIHYVLNLNLKKLTRINKMTQQAYKVKLAAKKTQNRPLVRK